MIIVAILGILAAIVIPEFQTHSQKAKEAAAKDNLRILREAIERYAIEHNGIPPGYPNNDINDSPSSFYFSAQLVVMATNSKGQLAEHGTPGYDYGPYITYIPTNPFNNKNSVAVFGKSTILSESITGVFGWLYKPSTREIRLDYEGTDDQGTDYIEY